MDLLLTNGLLNDRKTHLGIENGRIVYAGTDKIPSRQRINLRGKIVLPGMIDPHVHLRDMNLAYKETWESGSRSALAGGVTSVIDMPNSDPPLDSPPSYDKKMSAAKQSLVNFGFHLGVPDRIDDLEAMLKDSSRPVCGVKLFLAETSGNSVTSGIEHISSVLKCAASYNKIVLFHCEHPETLKKSRDKYMAESFNDISYHNTIRNPQAEVDAVRMIIDLVKETKAPAYICHLSLMDSYNMVRQAVSDGYPLYCELTPHHIFLSEDDVFHSGNFAKMNPPLRNKRDSHFLYEKMCEGEFDAYGSDHAPHLREEKCMPYNDAPSGIPGFETSYPLLIDQALRGFITLQDAAVYAAGKAASLFSISDRGYIREGCYADIVVVDPRQDYIVRPEEFETRAKYSPFSGRQLKGKIVMSFVNGCLSYDDGNYTSHKNAMQLY